MARCISGGSDEMSNFEALLRVLLDAIPISRDIVAGPVLTPASMPLTLVSSERDPSASGRLERSVQAMLCCVTGAAG